MKTTQTSASLPEKAIVTGTGIVTFVLAALVLAWFALSTFAKVLVVCVVPGIVYVPMRLILGAPLLPTQSPLPAGIDNDSSRLGFLVTALIMAYLQGYFTVLLAMFVFGCFVTPIGLLESFLSVKLLPAWLREVIWPVVGAAFAAGVAGAAIQDVKAERSSQ